MMKLLRGALMLLAFCSAGVIAPVAAIAVATTVDLAIGTVTAPASAITVATTADLVKAIKAAKGGETFALVPGVAYGMLNLNGLKFATPITIAGPGTISQVALSGCAGFTFKNVSIGRPVLAPESDWTRIASFESSSNITLDGVFIFAGSGDASKSLGWGVFARGGKGLTIVNSKFSNTSLAVNITQSSDIVVRGNTLIENRRDGFNFSAVTNVLVDGNTITNMRPINGEHPDGIQFYTAGTTSPSRGIVISNNVIMQGDGEPIQGIFARDEVGNLPYDGVTIDNNLIYINGLYHGIAVDDVANLKITNNTIASRTYDGIAAWISLSRTDKAVLKDNIADRLVTTATVTNLVDQGNRYLMSDSPLARQIGDLNAEARATVADLVVPGVGYQPKALQVRAAPSLLSLRFAAGGAVDSSRWRSSVVGLDPARIADGAYHVEPKAGLEISRSNSIQLFDLPAFTLATTVRAAKAGGSGMILGIFQSFQLVANSDGSLTLSGTAKDGKSWSIRSTKGVGVSDGQAHTVAIRYGPTVSLLVDGNAIATGTTSAGTKPLQSWGLYLGSQFSTAMDCYVGGIDITEAP